VLVEEVVEVVAEAVVPQVAVDQEQQVKALLVEAQTVLSTAVVAVVVVLAVLELQH
jgi:hypothetical protein